MKETNQQIAARVIEAVRTFVARATAPIVTRQESTDQILEDLERRISELEKRR